MPILLSSKVVRVPVNVGSSGGFVDQLTNAEPKFPIADLRVEAGFFFGKPNTTLQLVDLSNWTSVTCTLKAMGANNTAPAGNAAALAQVTVLAAALQADMEQADWDALTGYHAAFDFAEAQINNVSVGKVWCVFTALLNSGKVIPLQFSTFEAVQDGYSGTEAVEAAEGGAYTKAESLALFGLKERNDITARTGGGATALDGIATAAGAWTTGNSIRTRSGALGAREEWILETGVDAEDADAGIVRPDDYNAGTNARVWKQIL